MYHALCSLPLTSPLKLSQDLEERGKNAEIKTQYFGKIFRYLFEALKLQGNKNSASEGMEEMPPNSKGTAFFESLKDT